MCCLYDSTHVDLSDPPWGFIFVRVPLWFQGFNNVLLVTPSLWGGDVYLIGSFFGRKRIFEELICL